ncbi:MAG: hypothetical protein GWP08_07855 [Nitrospiraceae bacterium]|nr:hypothetical protein [Nitrospiraceae bacterium]
MKTIRIHPSPACLLALLVVCAFAHSPSDAAIAVQDTWAQDGVVALDGGAWRVAFRKGNPEVVFARGAEAVHIVPFGAASPSPNGAVSCEVLQDAGTTVRVVFGEGAATVETAFQFTESGMLCLKPGAGAKGVLLRGILEVGVLPGQQLEDVLYHADKYAGQGEVFVPADNWFAGLMRGGNGILACAWPEGEQAVSLVAGQEAEAAAFAAVRFAFGGKELYLGLLAAPAIWHREKLKRNYLERDIQLEWQRPFAAQYKTQLLMRGETAALRTFLFHNNRNQQFWPEIGNCTWPVWFEGEMAMLRLGKKIPPRGDAIIYPVEGNGQTLMGFVRQTPVAKLIEARNQRSPLPRGPRNAPNVGFVACGGTGIMRRTIIELGLQHRERRFLTEYADFLSDYVAIVQKRNVAFFRFIETTRGKAAAWMPEDDGQPELRAYLERMIALAQNAEKGLQAKMDLFGGDSPEAHMRNASEMADRLKELLNTDGTELSPECDEIIHVCNRLAWGHAESAGMRFSMLARQWAQDAAFACAATPDAVGYARTIRAGIRSALNGAPPW